MADTWVIRAVGIAFWCIGATLCYANGWFLVAMFAAFGAGAGLGGMIFILPSASQAERDGTRASPE